MSNTPTRARMTGLVVGGLVAVAMAVLAVVAWPASASDTAYDDGQRLGQAIVDLRDAETYEDVDDALTDVRHALRDAREHAGDELDAQLTSQQDAFFDAVNGFAGEHAADDEWEQELYEAELETAVDELTDNAEDFRTGTSDVSSAFWDGVQDGIEG